MGVGDYGGGEFFGLGDKCLQVALHLPTRVWRCQPAQLLLAVGKLKTHLLLPHAVRQAPSHPIQEVLKWESPELRQPYMPQEPRKLVVVLQLHHQGAAASTLT
ncbi:hypothetical protein JZ751_018788 [Albula glossodonta]|uniref:Uncharacterized protein n=1 Tax=Albula glossodonta TaxID=121402 RepID=A0A8T2NNT0_9TELE|nr:hypothetical protein JZ751_018788 [Albula glossodonta]